MKTIIALSLLMVSQVAQADGFAQTCLDLYRDATFMLIDSAQSFNERNSSAPQFLAEFALIESQIGAKRLICAFEPAEIKDCVRLYKTQYHKIGNRIDLLQIAEGNQTRVPVGGV